MWCQTVMRFFMPYGSRRFPPEMPAIAVKNAVVFPIPSLRLPLSVGRRRTLRAVESAADEDGLLFIVTQLEPHIEHPGPPDLYRFGTIARVLRLTRATKNHELIIEGICRGRIETFTAQDEMLRVEVTPLIDEELIDPESEALIRKMRALAATVIRLSPRIPDEALAVVDEIPEPGHVADLIASQLRLSVEQKQTIIEHIEIKPRILQVIEHLAHESAVLEISGKIQTDVQDSLDQYQREAYLREQLRAIRKELDDPSASEFDELDARILTANMPESAEKVARRELARMNRMNPQSAEFAIARSYLDWLLDVPWSRRTPDRINIEDAVHLLESKHFGLTPVKRRIIEFLAVRKLKADSSGPILCLVGPPGVGKTSLGQSVADALGRPCIRISLGGLRDEAEIRGHRRTYVGALPGRFVKGLKRAETMNPVFILDEIDKISRDFRGDPASALLEVLDPEQNGSFFDHYLDVPIDLSNVLFLATANRLDTIPPPLLDRMEVIEISGYTADEKREIGHRHLIPKVVSDHGFEPEQIQFDDAALTTVIERYTQEAGVRGLSRQLAAICRTVAHDVALKEITPPLAVDAGRIRIALGPPKVFLEASEEITTPGVAIGLAWTPVGGKILYVETALMPGKGTLTLTGKLGDVMKESAQTAMSYLQARADQLGIAPERFAKANVHLHLPGGSIPKDGPSAGITIATALASLMLDRPIKNGIAMTGELTLRGVVLPVGGIKDKILGAARAGITHFLIPRRNQADLDEIPDELRARLTIQLIDRIEEVLEIALGVSIRPIHRQLRASLPPRKAVA